MVKETRFHKEKLIQTQQNGVSFPVLTAYEIWLAQVGREPGCRLYFSLHDNGIQCITTPCLTVEEWLMNWPLKLTIAGADFYASGGDKEKIETAYQVMKTGVVIASGEHTTVSGPAGFSRAFSADEFYLPIRKVETCGGVVCPAGETCCNASCGLFTSPGWAFFQMTCD